MAPTLQVLIPTYDRPTSLAVTLATLVGQTCRDFGAIISDQSEGGGGEAGSALPLLTTNN